MVCVGFSELPSAYFGKTDGVNRLGSFLGVMGQSNLDMSGNPAEIDSGDRLSSEQYGQRIAEAVQRWA